ncbi:MAG: DoxX family protein [Deltaproteobacteria bacterium]|nr:DoxX family protein [Deltaproteobacteria bacterium]
MNYALWIVQWLLALLFLWAGGIKFVLPTEEMTKQMPVPLPGLFLRFIGVSEVLGALGLILPGLLHIRPGLTPLAAAGLVIINPGVGSNLLLFVKERCVKPSGADGPLGSLYGRVERRRTLAHTPCAGIRLQSVWQLLRPCPRHFLQERLPGQCSRQLLRAPDTRGGTED